VTAGIFETFDCPPASPGRRALRPSRQSVGKLCLAVLSMTGINSLWQWQAALAEMRLAKSLG